MSNNINNFLNVCYLKFMINFQIQAQFENSCQIVKHVISHKNVPQLTFKYDNRQ